MIKNSKKFCTSTTALFLVVPGLIWTAHPFLALDRITSNSSLQAEFPIGVAIQIPSDVNDPEVLVTSDAGGRKVVEESLLGKNDGGHTT